MLEAVRSGVSDIEAMVKVMYADVREELHKAAARSVLSHLIKLVDDGAVTVDGAGPDQRDTCPTLGDSRILVEDARLGDAVERFLHGRGE